MSAPQEVPRNTRSGRQFLHTVGQGDSTSSSEGEESDRMSTTSPVGLYDTPKKKNTLRNKVSKLKKSTRTLFRRTPKDDSEVVNEIPPNPDAIADDLEKHLDAQPVVSDTADAPVLPCEVLDAVVMECPTIALIVPLPKSESELWLPSPNDMSTGDGHSDHKSTKPDVTRTCTTELAELGHSEPTEPTELELELEPEPEPTRDTSRMSVKKAKAPKAATDMTPPPPVSSETSPYLFGRFTYYQVTVFTVAVIGICVVAAPQTYRLLRLR